MLTIIGDVHGKYNEYLKIIKKHKYTVQLGDFGFDYDVLENVNATKHKVGFGNHDNYDIGFNTPHNLGEFGLRKLNGIQFFFVRGGFSIDRDMRISYEAKTGRCSWWPQEELSQRQVELCLEEYRRVKPDVVIAHSPPSSICRRVGDPEVLKSFGFDPDTFETRTDRLLQDMIDSHQPSLFVAGHMHVSYDLKIDSTRFIGLDELETFTFVGHDV